jgi:hypothetical protein
MLKARGMTIVMTANYWMRRTTLRSVGHHRRGKIKTLGSPAEAENRAEGDIVSLTEGPE